MNIVIIGAGSVGRYISTILSKEQYNIFLIDKDEEKLERISWDMDVATRCGSGTDWQMLDDLLDLSPDFLIALTDDDETNLAACTIAKHLGYPRTIARVSDSRFLNRTRLDFSHIFEVDYFIGPELLAANDVLKFMMTPGALVVENFAHGAVQLRTIVVSSKWKREEIPLSKLELPKGVIVGLIKREDKMIFPHGDDTLLIGDEVTFIGETDAIAELPYYLGTKGAPVHSVVIVGGSLIGMNLAKILEQREIDVRLIEEDAEKCKVLAEQLPETTVINHESSDIEFFRSEKVGTADIFIACTESDEVNLITALLGKEVGCENTVVSLGNTNYVPLASKLGISHTVSVSVSAADHILSQVLSKNVTSLVSFYENQAEIMEVNVSLESKLVGIPLSELGGVLPKDFLIAMIQNRGRIMVAHGNRIISPGDSVIVITHPRHIPEIEKIF